MTREYIGGGRDAAALSVEDIEFLTWLGSFVGDAPIPYIIWEITHDAME